MLKIYTFLFLCLCLCLGAPGASAQSDKIYVKPETNAAAPRAKAAPAPRQAQPERPAPAYRQSCSDRELKAFLRAREALDAPIRYLEETSARGLSESEAEEFAVEAEKVLAKRKAIMDQPGFRKTYSDLSIRCHERANPAKK
jgi:hypothetical protein